jgi:hypothetical protein
MEETQLHRMEDLAARDSAPTAAVLVPEVRSGASFTFSASGAADAKRPAFLVVWIFTVKPDDRGTFKQHEAAYVASGTLPDAAGSGVTGVVYRGTYAVTVSGASPDFEYRTYWGLSDLSKLQDLNNYLNGAGQALLDMLKLISSRPPMRCEIMGLLGDSKGLGTG